MSAPQDLVPQASLGRRLALIRRAISYADRKKLVIIVAMLVIDTFSGVVQSVALKGMVDGALTGRLGLVTVAAIVGGLATGASSVVGRVLIDVPSVVGARVGLRLDTETLSRTAAFPGIEHLERSDYHDQVALLQGGGAQLFQSVLSLAHSVTVVVRMAVGIWLLAAVHPLLVVVPIFAIPSVLLAPLANRQIERSNVEGAEHARAAMQLHQLFVTPAPAMEMRVFGAQDALDQRAYDRWRSHASIALRGATRSAAVSAVGWTILTLGYVAALLFVAREAVLGRATPGDIVLVSQLALQLRGNVAQAAGVTGQTSAAFRTADRFLWLDELAERQRAEHAGTIPPPAVLSRGIRFESVSFTYPGTDRPVLSNIDVDLPAGSTVAIVGDNGAGKTSLIKLLTCLYRPTSGRILIDGTDLRDLDTAAWRARLAGAFQDFLRLEDTAQHTVGVGDLRHLDDEAAVMAALERADSTSLVAHLADGLDTPLGKSYSDGVELSGGQWQRLAIARAMMRDDPLCLVLDEPTAALDPAAEHNLYERYAAATRRARQSGGVTLLVSHRFSSVAMADHIIVLEDGHITEHGTHAALVARAGTYARMFRQQASAYT